ncbi:MAG TPA: thioredoxin domain-containing protein [Methylomirabilota bacterium]|jgi:protein-disulfide isomerase|nr:thioredoxin domain-containing protein [Methylomirabilota bacterium]
MRYLLAVAVVMCTVIAAAAPGLAQTSDELATIKREIDALKAGQAALQSELQAIKRLLGQARQAPSPGEAGPAAPENIEVSIGGAFAKGRPDARVTIVEFSDFQCPFCGRYVRQTFAQLDREYVETGKLRYVVRNLPLEQIHPDAFRAAEAAECAGTQGKYWEMHDRLFAHQDALGADDLSQHAAAVGVDMPAFRQCLDSRARADRIRQDMADAQAAGVTGTPTFLFAMTEPNAATVKVIGRIVGAHPYANFKAALDGLLSAGGPAK